MTPPEQPPTDRPGQYTYLLVAFLGVGMAFAGTAAAADVWPNGDDLGVGDSTTADSAMAYLVALAGWGFACVLWGIAAAMHARNGR